MVDIRQIRHDSLSTIQEEGTGSTDSHGTRYTRTLIDPYGQEFSTFPPDFGGAVFAISNDEPSSDRETDQERIAREERNADRRAWRVDLENAEEDAAVGGQRDIYRDLTDAFDMRDNQQVFKTPSANIAVAMNELNKLPESPALDVVKACLKAATVQVNERCTPTPSASSTRSHRQRGSWQRGGPYLSRAMTLTTRRTVPKIKAEGAMPTSMTPIKGVNVISKAGATHVMEGSVLQIVVAAMVDNAVPTRKWSSLEVTSVTTSAPI
jgi:hypothetical protein